MPHPSGLFGGVFSASSGDLKTDWVGRCSRIDLRILKPKDGQTAQSAGEAKVILKEKKLENATTTDRRNEPFFSVVMTTFNRAALLKRALDSLIAQTEKDWEAVIVDDGSSDDTALMVKGYLETHPNLSYLFQKNRGVVSAKNLGIFSSNGKFITFLDSDDEYLPSHLETRKAILMKNEDVGFLHGGVEIIGEQYVPDRFDHAVQIPLSECAISGTFIIRRDLARSLEGFVGTAMESDASLLERAEKAGAKILKTELPTYVYHHETMDSITNNIRTKQSGKP